MWQERDEVMLCKDTMRMSTRRSTGTDFGILNKYETREMCTRIESVGKESVVFYCNLHTYIQLHPIVHGKSCFECMCINNAFIYLQRHWRLKKGTEYRIASHRMSYQHYNYYCECILEVDGQASFH